MINWTGHWLKYQETTEVLALDLIENLQTLGKSLNAP